MSDDVILCGVVIEKSGDLERMCTSEAVYAIPLMDKDGVTPVDGVALCQEHSDKFDEGKSLVCHTRHGEHFLIQRELNPEDEEVILQEG